MLGFAAIAVACSIMAATFGLLVAALGKTAAATRRVATFAVLIMVMLGGAWVPSFIFPAWLQQITVVIPARWAVDGLDAMTWRGLGFDAAIVPTLVLLGFAVLFAVLTLARVPMGRSLTGHMPSLPVQNRFAESALRLRRMAS